MLAQLRARRRADLLGELIMWWSTLPYIEVPPSMTGGEAVLAPEQVPVFRSSVDCPASIWSAIESCPNIRNWFIAVALGGLLVGYLVARR